MTAAPTAARAPDEQDVVEFLGESGDAELAQMARQHLGVITALASAYTRGGGFDAGVPREDVAAVIVCATARLVTNPQQLSREQVGDYSSLGGFIGWTLPELAVLNRYRRRAA